MIVTALVASLCACSVNKTHRSMVDETQTLSPRVIKVGDPVPKGGGVFKIGDPYIANGKWYTPVNDQSYDQVGMASWYGDFFHGRRTANGELYDMEALTAAHPTLPMPSYVTVTSLDTGRTIVVRVNDRGPYHGGRIIDLSRKAAEALGIHTRGSGAVRVRYLSPAPLNGDDSLERSTLVRQPWAAQVVKPKQARAATPAPKTAIAQASSAPKTVIAQASPPPQTVVAQASPPQQMSLFSAAVVDEAFPVITKKGSFEKAPKDTGQGWVTNAQPNEPLR